MGGKALKFPKRKKFAKGEKRHVYEKKEEITKEEHESRLKLLKEMGFMKFKG